MQQNPAFGNMPVNPIHRTMQTTALPFSVNPIVDLMTMFYAGERLSPRPQSGTTQGLYDAYYLRQQTMQMRAAQQQALASSMPLARLGGINTDSPIFQMMAGLAGDPNGAVANFISPWIGGNPMKAQMGYLANLNTQAMTTFGRTGSITLPETSRMMHELNRFAYHHKAIGVADLRQNQADIMRVAGNHGGIMSDQIASMFGQDGRINQGSYDQFRTGYSKAADLNSKLANTTDPKQVENIQKAMINAFTDEKTKKALETAFAKGGSGKQLSEEVEKVLQIKKMNSLLGGTLASHITDQNNLGRMRPTGINYQNTMGLNLEDFSGAFTTLATAKLFDKSTTHKDFLRSAPADLIDAAKGLFGNDKSGAEAMAELQEMLGVSFFNAGNLSESSKLTDSIRNLKALARNADISLEAMIGLVKDANRISSQIQGLQYLGGKENVRLVDDVVRRATAIAGAASNDYVRRQGGMPGVVAGQMEATFSAVSQPISRQVAALAYQFRDNAQAQQAIAQYIQSDNMHNAGGFSQLVRRLSGVTGMATSQLLQASQNTTAQNMGTRMNPTGFRHLGESAVANRFIRDLNRVGHLSRMGSNYGQRLIDQLAAKGQIDPDELLANPIISQSPQLLRFVEANKGILANALMQRSPAGRRVLHELDQATKQDRIMEEFINKNYGHLNAPAGQAMLDQMFKMGPDGRFTDFFKPLIDGTGTNLADLQRVAENSAVIHNATTFQQVNERATFFDPNTGRVLGAEATAALKRELAGYNDTSHVNNVVSKLARSTGVSESELLEKMNSFKTETKDANGRIISIEEQRNNYITQLAQNAGLTAEQTERFRRMNHADAAKKLRELGLAGVNMNDLDAVKGGLRAKHRNIVVDLALKKGYAKVDERLAATIKPNTIKGYADLERAALQDSQNKGSKTLSLNDVLTGNFDPASEAGKRMMEARNKFLKGHIGDKRADETDEAYFARGMENKVVKQFVTRTAELAKKAGVIKNIGQQAGGAPTDTLPTSMKKLTELMDKLPGLLTALTTALQEATKTTP